MAHRVCAHLAREALVAALEQWPQSGVPNNPAAWLTATAKRRAGGRGQRPTATPTTESVAEGRSFEYRTNGGDEHGGAKSAFSIQAPADSRNR